MGMLRDYRNRLQSRAASRLSSSEGGLGGGPEALEQRLAELIAAGAGGEDARIISLLEKESKRLLPRRWKLETEAKGNSYCDTERRVVVVELPFKDDGADPEWYALWVLGMLYHEIGHALYTIYRERDSAEELASMQALLGRGCSVDQAVAMAYWIYNQLADIHVDAELAKERPETAGVLARKQANSYLGFCRHLCKDNGIEPGPEGPGQLPKGEQLWLLAYAYRAGIQSSATAPQDVRDVFERLRPHLVAAQREDLSRTGWLPILSIMLEEDMLPQLMIDRSIGLRPQFYKEQVDRWHGVLDEWLAERPRLGELAETSSPFRPQPALAAVSPQIDC